MKSEPTVKICPTSCETAMINFNDRSYVLTPFFWAAVSVTIHSAAHFLALKTEEADSP